jgi:hypothetical protein
MTPDAIASKMELRDITDLAQLEEYYKQKGLVTAEAKIAHLKDAMHVQAVRCEFGSTADDLLIGLEDSFLMGNWKAYSNA